MTTLRTTLEEHLEDRGFSPACVQRVMTIMRLAIDSVQSSEKANMTEGERALYAYRIRELIDCMAVLCTLAEQEQVA